MSWFSASVVFNVGDALLAGGIDSDSESVLDNHSASDGSRNCDALLLFRLDELCLVVSSMQKELPLQFR